MNEYMIKNNMQIISPTAHEEGGGDAAMAPPNTAASR